MYGVIYKIVSNIDGRIYIGQSINFKERICYYKRYGKNPHKNSRIELAIHKYGFENFHYYIIDFADNQEMLDYKEKFWIRVYSSDICGIGFNIESGGKGKGKVSEETKQKISKAHKGKIFTEEVKQKISEAKKGIKASEETKEKLSKAQKDRYKNMSEEDKKLISESMIGEKNPFYGKHHTEENKKFFSEMNTGKILSEEHKNKISESIMGEKNPFYGKHHTQESLLKFSGENGGTSKLSLQDVLDIRENKDCLSRKELSIKYSVTESTISRIINNKRWSNPEFFNKKEGANE